MGLMTEISFDGFMRPKLKLIQEPGDTPEDPIQAQVEFLRVMLVPKFEEVTLGKG